MESPRVFIGSSKEGLPIAHAVSSHIQSDSIPTIWDQGIFLPGQYAFETLEEQLKNHDFAIMIATPDDELTKRGKSTLTMRDNVLLEFGLFAGVLGRKRTFLLIPMSQELNIPSDILGIMPVIYEDNLIAKNNSKIQMAVKGSCSLILKAIKKECLLKEKKIEKLNLKARNSKKGQAIKHLHDVVIQVRDAAMLLQNEILEALSDHEAFEEVKRKACAAIQEIGKDLYIDAKEIGIIKELNSLVNCTKNALQDLPFPHELTMGENEMENKAIKVGLGALEAYLTGGDPVNEVKKTATSEIEERISSLKKRFSKWWEKHYPIIQSETVKLQDALFKASMDLAFNLKRF